MVQALVSNLGKRIPRPPMCCKLRLQWDSLTGEAHRNKIEHAGPEGYRVQALEHLFTGRFGAQKRPGENSDPDAGE